MNTGPRSSPITLALLRAVVIVEAALVVAQPVLAGAYLSGSYDALGVHALNAGIVMALAMTAGAAALLHWLVGRGRFWPVPATATLFLGAGFQTGMGYARELGIHIPLGVALVIAALGIAAAILRRSAGARRAPLGWRDLLGQRASVDDAGSATAVPR